MQFTDKEIENIQLIFKHLDPGTSMNLQLFYPECKNRLNYTFYIKNKSGQITYLFQYFNNLSKPRLKILERRKKEVLHNIYIVKSSEEIVCIGFKCE